VRLEGELLDDRVRVQHFDTVTPEDTDIGVFRERVIVENGVTTRKAAILKVYWGSNDGVTDEQLRGVTFDGNTSANALFGESSFGKLHFTGDVFGWLTIPNPGDCGDIYQISQLAQQAASGAGIDLAQYDHVAYYVGELNDPTCDWAGWGEVGTPAFPARQTWYKYWSTSIFAHEWGHNIGFWHGHSYACGTAIAEPERCTLDEYGDPFDPMGTSTTQFNAYHKAAQGWFSGCNLVTTPKSGIFTLSPLEVSTTGQQALRIPLSPALCPLTGSTDCYYYLESRKALGAFDGAEFYATTPMTDGVLIHANVGVDSTGQSGLTGPYLLDTTPSVSHDYGPFWNASLSTNKNFGDASGVRVRVLSQTANSVKVAVKVPGGTGSATCTDGSTFSLPAACANGVKNTGETDVDCGGTSCVPCDEGKSCSLARDCWSGTCTGGKCQPTCSDGIKNGSESDVDCGGSCGDCVDGLSCATSGDCLSGLCNGGRCMQDDLRATLNVHSNWDTGYCATIDLHNVSATPTWDWSVEVDFTDSGFYATSGAVFNWKAGNVYRLTPEPWGYTIWPQSHASISFCAYKYGSGYVPEIEYVTAQF
jgi:hypothetical protein